MSDSNAQPSASEQIWDSPQYEASLAHLEQVQDKLDGLRSLIPSLIAPLLKPASSKAQLFADIRKAAVQCTSNLKHFQADWTSEQTQQLLSRSRESFEKDGDLSKAHSVPKYGWSQS